MKIRPEEKVELMLWDWLNKNEYVEIYFNRKNKLGWKKFNVKGKSRGKPDLIIEFFDKFKGKQYIAVEVKDGGTNRNVLDASKIFSKYYLNYIKGKTNYLIDENKIAINHFIVATQFSPFGKIMFNDNIIVDNIDKGNNDEWRSMSAQNKTLPRCEFEKTRIYTRSLWAMLREFRNNKKNKNKFILKPSLGVLVSDVLKNFHPTELKIQSGMKGKPMIQVMQWKDWLKKPQWGQGFKYLK